MASNEHLSPVPNTAHLKAIEIIDINGLENKKSYFVTISVDGSVGVESEKKKKYSSDPTLRWEWTEELKFGVHPSSTVEIKVYRRSLKAPLFNHHLVGEHTRKFIELIDQDGNTTLDLKAENGASITPKIKLTLTLDPETNQEFKRFMDSIDSSITRLDDSTIQIPNAIGTALQLTKNIMDAVAGAHPIIKASWTVLSVVYDAVRKVEVQDDSVRELAEGLKELLAVANQHRDLLVVEGTDNVIEEIGRMSLKVNSLIYEYAKPKFARRAVNLQLSDDLRKKITDCQKSCNSLKERFDRRVNMETNKMVKDIKDDNANIRCTLDLVKDEQLADKIWQWLSAPDSSPNYHAAREKHQDGTFDWFLEGEWFRNFWEEAGFLWIKGTAGCGKTVLCSSIIAKIIRLYEETEDSSSEAYGLFFFDGRDSQKDLQLHDKLIRSLIRQLSAQCDGVPTALVNLYRAQSHQQPSITSLQNTLRTIIEGFDSVYIVIDSLDECVEREKTLLWIEEIVSQKVANNLHMVVASRPEHDISVALQSLRPDISFVNLVEEVNEDIISYLDKNVQLLKKWDDETRESVKSTLREGAQGMFRWVALQLIELQKCSTKSAVMKQLQNLPKGLYETYDRILSKIDSQTDSADTKTFLRLLSFSIQPMTLKEIAASAAVEFKNDSDDEPQYEPLHQYWDEDDVLGKCSGLITQTDNGRVKLSHFSVKEYLLSDYLRSRALSTFHLISAEHSHSIISQICLAYLLHFDSLDSLNKNFEKSFPLACYAAEYWIDHIRSANIDKSETSVTWTLACQLFDPDGITLTNWVRIWNIDRSWEDPDPERSLAATPLYYASLAGAAPVVQHLLKMGAEVNLAGGECGSALQAASKEGHTDIIELLLKHGADVNLARGHYGSALQAASGGGNTTIVELLLEHGADVNLAGGEYGSALQAASVKGHTTIVELLLEHEADVNLAGGQYGSALQAASLAGHTAIVELLLEHEADVNLDGGRLGCALLVASYMGRTAIIELLLEHGVDVNLAGGECDSALQAASSRGHTATVKLLLEHGADVNLAGGDYDYSSALHAASAEGCTAIVELLLEHGADVNLAGGEYGSALQAASRGGNTTIVELLLEHEADVNLAGGEYGSALQAASVKGHTAVVELLLKHGADVNLAGGEYGSALEVASGNGETTMVELLLKHRPAITLEEGFFSALQAASANGYTDIVKLLRDTHQRALVAWSESFGLEYS